MNVTEHVELAHYVDEMFTAPEQAAARQVAGTDVDESLFVEYHQRESLSWAGKLLSEIEDHAASALFTHYQRRLKKGGHTRSANIWLRKSVEQIRRHAVRFPLPMRAIANELGRANVAREWANRCQQIVLDQTQHLTQYTSAEQLLILAMHPAHQWGISPVLPNFNKSDGDELTDQQLTMTVAALARLQCADWWQRQITRAWRRYAEHVAILVGRVRRGVSAYVSQSALKDYRARKAANAAWLKEMFAINTELALEIPLAEAVAASVSNPEVRRTELMVRMRGFENIAKDQDWVGEFYTWTAPSRFHSWTVNRQNKSMQNPRYQGATPRETQTYLCGQWAKARAKLARLNVKLFGFRVVEPHHDATPHWHLLLFVHPKQRFLLRWVLRRYACQHDKAELAKSYKPRFDWQVIDPTKGSATGYIAKYIAKNIDGHKIEIDDESGECAINSAAAVAAWSSLWGIRQFQQIGGPSVSVWRELRRLREVTRNPILEGARIAADHGRWHDFILAMGGIDIQRKDHLIKLQHLVEEASSKYGEDVKKLSGLSTGEITLSVNGVVSGLMLGHSEIVTRHQGWELSRFGLSEHSEQLLSGGSRAPWSPDNKCTQVPIGSEISQIDHEMAMLGLCSVDRQRLEAGSIITVDGLYIRIRDNQLITTTEFPNKQHTAVDDFGFEAPPSSHETWHTRILNELLSGAVPVDTFLDSIPSPELSSVIRQVDDALQQERFDNPKTYQENPLMLMLQQLITDTINDHDFREVFLG
ncbi:replication endonuclease [Motilimonas sp. 1_MG-2023]|uniref:replication endonuclease n=1 Tax=Motilimonas sp. 1_MG-2023 TaxID=3062672 RepID=UPI0026E34E5A|nr:replication endonuclease [Motilimonas sp. 1_MG-2023]MDO6525414.1 replication endonuclease [Motilimonas sp. 1_MG-2023]